MRMQNFKLKAKNRGFTLVEMISVLVIVGVLGGVSTYFTVDIALIYSNAKQQMDLLQDARRTMRLLNREIVSSSNIVDPIRPAIGEAPNSTNRIQFDRTFRGGNITNLVYDFDGANNRIIRVSDTDGMVPVTNNVESFVVKRDGYNLIRVEVTFDNGISRPITLSTAIRPRGFPSPP